MKHVKESGISLSYTAILNAFADQTSFSTLPFLDTLLCANARAQSVAALTEAGALSSESLSPSLNRDFDFADAKNFSFYYTEKGVLKKQIELMEIFRGLMPYLGIVILCMVLMYQFPGIALWLPDYLFGAYIP